MDNLINVIKILFRRISTKHILSGDICYDNFSCENFKQLANCYISQYSNNEIDNMYNYLINELDNQRNRMLGRTLLKSHSGFNVFDTLFVADEKILIEKKGYPVCNYNNLLNWRLISYDLGEDIFTTSFFAYKRVNYDDYVKDFYWRPVIGHNNVKLNTILAKGMAENHFHLYGSASYFILNWLCLMNNIESPRVSVILKNFDDRRLSMNINYHWQYAGESLYISCLKASLIRAFLYTKLFNAAIVFEDYCIEINEIKKYIDISAINDKKVLVIKEKSVVLPNCKDEVFNFYQLLKCTTEAHNNINSFIDQNRAIKGLLPIFSSIDYTRDFFSKANDNCISFRELMILIIKNNCQLKLSSLEGVLSSAEFNEICAWKNDEFVDKLLKSDSDIEQYRSVIQRFINDLKNYNYDKKMDYTLHAIKSQKPVRGYGSDPIIGGERWFLFCMFRKIYSKDRAFSKYFNYFYAYLVIKANFRAEMIQINDNVGFDNFYLYQSRKTSFIDGTLFEKYLSRLAVRDTLNNEPIKCMEVRIAPGHSAESFKKYIVGLDKEICKKDVLHLAQPLHLLSHNTNYPSKVQNDYGLYDYELKRKYFYVVHFIKGPEKVCTPLPWGRCRNFAKRNEIKSQAMMIKCFREKYPEVACRLLGIDAANFEIGCRPEVFAQAFRYLREHMHFPDKRCSDEQLVQLPQLMVTYHVGEDYLDVVDGLRAIDEASYHLNMHCGDRMGHAIVLGIDVQQWYASKNNVILISKQDYLDNIVWLYSKIRRFEIKNNQMQILLNDLENKYISFFREIYLDNIDESLFRNIIKNAKIANNNNDTVNSFTNSTYLYDINTYYDSWKLRSDDPYCYENGYYNANEIASGHAWSNFSTNMLYPNNYKLRYNPEAAFLYYLYHFDPNVKEEGAKIIEVKVNQLFIKGAAAVQRSLQQSIRARGIGIETNPSSNYVIGTFKRYDKHPIVSFFNLGLTNDIDMQNNCPQLSVSINTDDQGVFATYLDNEYALLALAMEKLQDVDGNLKYNKERVYKWIDNIREMGLEQSFMNANNRVPNNEYFE